MACSPPRPRTSAPRTSSSGGRVTLRGFWLSVWLDSVAPEARGRVAAETVAAFAERKVGTEIGKTFPLERVAEAVEESERGSGGGKVMLVG